MAIRIDNWCMSSARQVVCVIAVDVDVLGTGCACLKQDRKKSCEKSSPICPNE